MKPFNWASMLAHSHWITIDFGKRSLRVCARCSGVVIGWIAALSLAIYIDLSFFFSLHLLNQISLCLFLAMPAILDWVTQTRGLRESSNTARLLTGFGEGVSISLLTFITIPFIYKFLLMLLVAGLTLGFSVIGQRRVENSR